MSPLSEEERKTLVRILNKIAGQPASSAHIEAAPVAEAART
jgi:hypothetical protein